MDAGELKNRQSRNSENSIKGNFMSRSVRMRIVIQVRKTEENGDYSWVEQLCKAPDGELIPFEISVKVAENAYAAGYEVLDASSFIVGPD